MANQEQVSTYGTGRKTVQSYVTGLILSLIFTLTAFSLVGWHLVSTTSLYIILPILAVLQLFVQVNYFLRMNISPESRGNFMPFLFTLVIILVIVMGSLWIMLNLNYNLVH